MVVVALCLAMTVALLPPVPASAANDAAGEADLACRVNAEREVNGRAALRVASDLSRIAREHSVRMADRNLLHHNSKLTTDVTGWTALAENVARGSSIASIHAALMDSSKHRANILDGRMTEMGIGVERRGSTYWVTQVFRRPETSSSAPFPTCTTQTAASLVALPPGGLPVAGDWNGDGRSSPGRFVDGTWYLSDSTGQRVERVFSFGRRGDLPIVGDWNGSGRAGVGVVRDGDWHLRNSLTSGAPTVSFIYGRVTRGDVPIAGDWNGNGRAGIGIIRDGEWHLRNSLSGGSAHIRFTYGRITRGDVPLIGDWNANGQDTVGIVRDGEWHLRNTLSGGNGQIVFTYGRVLRGDVPVIGDWNRSGSSGISIVRGEEWHIRNTLSGGNAQLVLRY